MKDTDLAGRNVPTTSPFEPYLAEWRRLDGELANLLRAQETAEWRAIDRRVRWEDCPKIAAIVKEETEIFRARKGLIRLAARAPATTLDDVVFKLALWRLADLDAETFANPSDMLSFSAWRDLLALTGREALAPPADVKALALLFDDDAFAEKNDT